MATFEGKKKTDPDFLIFLLKILEKFRVSHGKVSIIKRNIYPWVYTFFYQLFCLIKIVFQIHLFLYSSTSPLKLSKRSFHTTFGDDENTNQSGNNMTSCLNQLEIKSTGNIKRSNSRINLTFKKPKYDLDDDSSLVSESNDEAGHATSIEDKDDTTPLSSLQGTAKKRNVR